MTSRIRRTTLTLVLIAAILVSFRWHVTNKTNSGRRRANSRIKLVPATHESPVNTYINEKEENIVKKHVQNAVRKVDETAKMSRYQTGSKNETGLATEIKPENGDPAMNISEEGSLSHILLPEKAQTVIDRYTGKTRYVFGSDVIADMKRSGELKGITSKYITDLLFSNYQHNGGLTELVSEREERVTADLPLKTIAVYSSSFKELAALHMGSCAQYNNCKLLDYTKRTILDASAIVFDASNVQSKPPVRRSANQVLVYMSRAPNNVPSRSNESFIGSYNWTMTHELDSDIPVPATMVLPRTYRWRALKTEGEMTGTYSNVRLHDDYTFEIQANPTGLPSRNYNIIYDAKNTDRLAVLVTHACKVDSKLNEIKSLLNVDVISPCSKSITYCTSADLPCIFRTYKFYFVLGTARNDFITNMVLRAYEEDIIIVVWGGANYSKLFPKGTYIDAEQFTSPADLASYLSELAEDRNKYLKYVKRKDMFATIPHHEIQHLALCHLCYRLNRLELYR